MAQKCKVCVHPNKEQIEAEIVQGLAHTRIAEKHGIHFMNVRWHSENHLPGKLMKSAEIREKASADTLLAEIDICMSKAKGVLAQAENDNKPGLQLQAIREIRASVEFLSRLAVSLAALEQDREFSERATNSGQSGPVVILPAKVSLEREAIIDVEPEPEPDQEPAPVRRRRRRRAGEDEPDEDERPAILDWQPEIPLKGSGWPGAVRVE